ncbi:MAG: hypothetical protein U0414_19210 [Polyangiaceae bacterium]
MPTRMNVPLRTPAHGGVSRAIVARFIRAESGAPKLHAPDIDDRGFRTSDDTTWNRVARGPTVGMTIGGPRIHVRLVRDGLPDALPLYVSLEPVDGKPSVVALASPRHGETLTTQQAGFHADHVYLDSFVAGSLAEPEDAALALEEAENERLVVGWLAATKRRFEAALEATATAECTKAAIVRTPAEQTFLQALERYVGGLPVGDPTRDRIEGAIGLARREIDDLFECVDDQGVPIDAAAIEASDLPLQARVDAITNAIARRRFAATLPRSAFKVLVRVGSSSGPIVAELGVAALPPLDIEIQPYVVSLGGQSMKNAKGLDILHRLFADTIPDVVARMKAAENPPKAAKKPKKPKKVAAAPAAPPALTYTTFSVALTLLNTIYAPAGIRFYARPSRVKCFRFADQKDAPKGALDKAERADDPHGWNTYLPHFNDLFPPGGMPVGRWNWQEGQPPAWVGRDDPWLNLLMNANPSKEEHKLQREHKLNVWCVRWVLDEGVVQPSTLAIGKGPFSSTQPAAKVPYSIDKDHVFDVELGPDQIGAVVAVDASTPAPEPWHSLVVFARALGHEIGHICGLTHYMGGQKGGDPWPVLNDPWAHRSLMSNAQFTVVPPDVDYDIGWSPPGAWMTGALISMKMHGDVNLPAMKADALAADPTGKTVESGAHTRPNNIAAGQEIRLVRDTFENARYFGSGAK